ncbi:hypothetical protein ALC152_16100 [Arcobacter sp. 15-2]|uniref:hypothetical protein n=1 Tax=Arcobacter sp. 15-2 TaxID=3374109 RepID=UPI00399D180F
MQGKTKSFFEDTIIILVLAVIIIVGYTLYSKYQDKTSIDEMLNSTAKSIEKFITIIKKVPLEIQKILNAEQNSYSEVLFADTNTTNIKKINVEEQIDVNNTIQKIAPTIEDVNISSVTVSNTVEKTIAKETLDVILLRDFLKSLKSKLRKSIVQNSELNVTKNQKLRFRITLLKDGSYEQLKFIGGDKELFETNKENILQNFPVEIDSSIQQEFPRYIRINLQ